MTGIRTIADLKDRCHVDEDTGCWHWRGAMQRGRYPSLRVSALGITTTAGVAICFLLTGKRPAKGVAWHSTCRNTDCANPAHREPGTRSTQMTAHAIRRTPLTRALISANRRGGSRLSEDQIAEIEGSAEKLSALCDRYGICMSYASLLRRGMTRAAVAAPGSSVFAQAGRQ